MRSLWTGVIVLLVSCTGASPSGDRVSASPARSATPTSSVPSPFKQNATHAFQFNEKKFEVPVENLPYPFTTPIPPPEPTRLDGTYLRILTLEDMNGLLPFRCLRCPPYFPNAGVSTLVLYRGNYWLNHQLSQFKALGMFTIDGHRITFFNDPWCPQDRGVYRWDLRDDVLTFEAIRGRCVYEEARANDLTKVPWTEIKPCIYRIEYLWPGPVAC